MSYNWRRMTDEERAAALDRRQQLGQPWHGPPHGLERHWYHLAAACFEHQPIAGINAERLAELERELLQTVTQVCERVCVWCVLPDHYHLLIQCSRLPICRQALGRLHGRLSHRWNTEDGCRGRTCWHRCLPRAIDSESHRWAVVNYIHHNPVRHGYVVHWQDWPFSSAAQYLASFGRAEAARIWHAYPILEMGKHWDPPER